MKNKKHGGFSYVEILFALALFTIILAAILPALLQSARNMRFADLRYNGHRQANGMMLAIRDTISDRTIPLQDAAVTAAYAYANKHNVEFFSFWIFDETAHIITDYMYKSTGAPEDAVVTLADITTPIIDGSCIIVVMLWNRDGDMIGRSTGVAIPWTETGDEHEIP